MKKEKKNVNLCGAMKHHPDAMAFNDNIIAKLHNPFLIRRKLCLR
jgi:hypothetical protein